MLFFIIYLSIILLDKRDVCMYYLKKKNIFYRKDYSKNELNLLMLRYISNNRNLSKFSRLAFHNKSCAMKLPKNIKNRCTLTNRKYSLLSPFYLSSIALREQILKGNITGLTKASW